MYLIRRQDSTLTSSNTGPPDPTLNPHPANAPQTALEPWTIALIVILSLISLGVLGTIFIQIRTRRAMRRGASTTRFNEQSSNIGPDFDSFAVEPSTSVTAEQRRHSVVDDAKVHIRRLLRKPTRPSAPTRPRSSSYPAPNKKKSGGLEFGLGALRFGSSGHGGEKGYDEAREGGGLGLGGGGKKGRRRKSQSGLDVRLRSADGHEDEYYGWSPPFMRNENGTTGSGSGFRLGSAGSTSGFVSASTPRREHDDGVALGAAAGGPPAPGRMASRGRESEELSWNYYADQSIAHTVRGSFEDAEEEQRQRTIMQQLQQHQLGEAVQRLAAERAAVDGTRPTRL